MKGSKMKAMSDLLKGGLLWCLTGVGISIKIGMAAFGATISAWIIFFLPSDLIELRFGADPASGWIVIALDIIGMLFWFGVFGYFMKDMMSSVISEKGRKLYAWERFQAKKDLTRREFLQAGIADETKKEP